MNEAEATAARALASLSRRQLVRGLAGVSLSAAGLALLGGCAGPAAQPPRSGRIGWLVVLPSSAVASSPQSEGLRLGLRERGWEEGRNLTIVIRSADEQISRLPDLAAELVRLPVDVIVASGAPAIRAAKDATSTIPIVMAQTADPVAPGLVASLGRPGGNLTGLSNIQDQLQGKRLEQFKEAVPRINRVAVLWNPAIPDRVGEFTAVSAAAPILGVQLVSLEVREPGDFDQAFETALRERTDALFLLENFLTLEHAPRIADFAAQHGLPSMGIGLAYVVAGGLMAYGPNITDQYRRVAHFVDRILRGTKPGDLPVEQPMTFDLVLNFKTAEALGITFPRDTLIQATDVIR